jgi:CheY-like chemotaxis protein
MQSTQLLGVGAFEPVARPESPYVRHAISRAFDEGRLSESNGRPARILLVDDDAATRHVVASYLEEHNMRVVSAWQKQDVARQFAAGEPGLVILDLRLDTSVDTVARTRQRLVEEGFEAALVCKHSPASARKRIFDGAAEAKVIKRWTLQLLEEQVVELKIVDRASDNTIGRTLKKTFSSLTSKNNGSFRRMPTPPS